jgi:hypothetical protein
MQHVPGTGITGTGIIRAAGILGVALLLVAVSAASATATISGGWAWVTVRQATPDTSPFTPDATDQGSSTGATDQVFHPFPGMYVIQLTGLGSEPVGIAHVSMLGSRHRICSPDRPFLNGPDAIVQVLCYDDTPAATAADATFTVSYVSESSDSLSHGAMAYLLAFPDGQPGVSYNSAGGSNAFKRVDFGVFSVRLGRMGSFRGVLLATSRNRGVTCQVRDQVARRGGPLIATVYCASLADVGQDDPFTVTFLSRLGLKGSGGVSSATLFADRPTARSYTPPVAWSSVGRVGEPRVSRLGVGRYSVRLPGMPPGGAAQVTAFGAHGRRCVIRQIPLAGAPPQRIDVRCSHLDGTAADARFFLAYEG